MGATSAMSAGERKLADRIARAASRVLPGNESLWRPLGHVVSLAAIAGVTRYAMQRGFGMIEDREESVEPSFDVPPPSSTLSGSIDSEVPYDTMSKQGRRFVWNAQPAEMITQVMGEDAMDVIRVYVGLESAETDVERVELAMRELERTHAFDREWLLIDLPTGTGYVNYAAVSVLEMLSRRELRDRRDAIRGAAVAAVARPCRRRSHDRLGSSSTRSPSGSAGCRTHPVPRSCCSARASARGRARTRSWTRARMASSMPASTTRSGSGRRTSVSGRNRSSATSEPTSPPSWSASSTTSANGKRPRPSSASSMRYVMITHHNDGVARFGPGLIIQAPDWLGHPDATLAGDPEGHAVDADHDVLPGARRHEELGQRGSRRVRGDRSRLPSRPASVLPCRSSASRSPTIRCSDSPNGSRSGKSYEASG